MQAQVEPHFLFNTLASVQFLTETDPREANRLLGHLIAYLRAALPQLRARSTTLGQEVELAEAYLNILRMRMGARSLHDRRAGRARDASVSAEPADLARRERDQARHRAARRAAARSPCVRGARAGSLIVTVADTGRGLGDASRSGQGVGPRQRARAPRRAVRHAGAVHARARRSAGARATLAVPLEATSSRRADLAHRPRARRRNADRADRRRRADAARQLRRGCREAWPELRIVAEATTASEALALARSTARHRVPRHPDAGDVGPRGRARARRPLPHRVRHRLRRVRGRRVRGRRGRLRAEAGRRPSASRRSSRGCKARLGDAARSTSRRC